MRSTFFFLSSIIFFISTLNAGTIRKPKDDSTIKRYIDANSAGDSNGEISNTYHNKMGCSVDSSIIHYDIIHNLEISNLDSGLLINPMTRSQYNLEVDSVYFVHGDTAILPINNISVFSLSSIELKIAGYQGILEFIDIEDDEGTHFGDLGWMTVYNNTDTLLITASAGSVPISTSGTLFNLLLAIPEDLESQFVPITITDFVGNEDFTDFNVIPGGVQSVWGPEVAFSLDVVNGSYPLEVNFLDESAAGTFPIDVWNWTFGNDLISGEQNPTFTYLYPGEYDISLTVEDEFNLRDTVFYTSLIQVDTLYGDVTFNSMVQSFDASMILRNLVDLEPLTPLQMKVGDVSLNDTLSTLDANYILQYMVGLIESLPYVPAEEAESGGEFVMDDIIAESGTIINIPVMIQDARNFNGFKGSIVYDPTAFSLDTLIFTDYLNNYLIEYNESAPGEIKIAASGIQPAEPNGVLAIVSLLVLDGFNFESSIRLEHVMINENSSSDVGTEMMVSSELGIRGHSIPDRYSLHQNYPNPFNPTTKISYDLLEETNVKILIFDTMGRYVNTLVDDNQRAGHHYAFWNGANKSGYSVSAGVYVYVIQAGGFYEMKKMILLK